MFICTTVVLLLQSRFAALRTLAAGWHCCFTVVLRDYFHFLVL